jgi:hypothetical protein
MELQQSFEDFPRAPDLGSLSPGYLRSALIVQVQQRFIKKIDRFERDIDMGIVFHGNLPAAKLGLIIQENAISSDAIFGNNLYFPPTSVNKYFKNKYKFIHINAGKKIRDEGYRKKTLDQRTAFDRDSISKKNDGPAV